jgi:hypothetical protein
MGDEDLRSLVAADLASTVVPGTGAIVQRLLEKVRDEWSSNSSAAMVAAVTTSGLTREDLAERIEERPELVPLVTRLLFEAAMTGRGPTLEAMGAVFGAAVRDPSKVEPFQVLLAEMSSLTADDVLVLRHMRERSVFRNEDDERKDEPAWADRTWQESRELAADLGMNVETLMFSLVRLAGHGFVRTSPALGGTHYTLTEMGLLLYDALERLADGQRDT